VLVIWFVLMPGCDYGVCWFVLVKPHQPCDNFDMLSS